MNKNTPRWLLILFMIILLFACNIPSKKTDSAAQIPNTQTSEGQETAAEGQIYTDTPETDETLSPQGESLPAQIPPPELGDTIKWLDGSLLVYIPEGEFIMGLGTEENPAFEVYLDGFWIYRTEVTNRMYLRCMEMGECSPPAVDPSLPELENPDLTDHPVVGVTWDQAENYCKFVGGSLPTEAQWEKTARGPDAYDYPWGENEPKCSLLNFKNCLGEISPVLDYPSGASPYEVLDMAGNVFEWVADWYEEDYYAVSPSTNPMGPEFGEVRSVRGSTFKSEPDQIISALRYFLEPEKYRLDLGFRCVVGSAHEFAPPCEVLAYVPPDSEGENPTEPPGGSAACVVPQPEISVITYCDEGRRGNNISWTPADAEVDYSTSGGVSCSMYDADTLACAGDPGGEVLITVCKACPPPVVELGIPAVCDAPYVLDESISLCRYAGPPLPGEVICAPGYSPDPEGACCDIVDGSPLDFPICPVGGRFETTSKICWFLLPSSGDEKCDSQSVTFDFCPAPQEPGPDADSCAGYSYAECLNHKNECYWDIDTIPEVCRSLP